MHTNRGLAVLALNRTEKAHCGVCCGMGAPERRHPLQLLRARHLGRPTGRPTGEHIFGHHRLQFLRRVGECRHRRDADLVYQKARGRAQTIILAGTKAPSCAHHSSFSLLVCYGCPPAPGSLVCVDMSNTGWRSCVSLGDSASATPGPAPNPESATAPAAFASIPDDPPREYTAASAVDTSGRFNLDARDGGERLCRLGNGRHRLRFYLVGLVAHLCLRG